MKFKEGKGRNQIQAITNVNNKRAQQAGMSEAAIAITNRTGELRLS